MTSKQKSPQPILPYKDLIPFTEPKRAASKSQKKKVSSPSKFRRIAPLIEKI